MAMPGEMEAAACDRIALFAQEYLGRRPQRVRAYLLKGLFVVRLQGVLNAAEVQVARTPEKSRGRDLIKAMRSELVETARPILVGLVEEVTGIRVLSLHHDLSTVTGEEVMVFTLTEEDSTLLASRR